MTLGKLSDEELLHRVEKDDESALRRLFERHYESLHRLALSIDAKGHVAEDAVVRVFERLWRKRKELNLHGNLKSYLLVSTRNQVKNLLRKEMFRKKSVEDWAGTLEGMDSGDVNGLERLENSELHNEIERLIMTLPDIRKEVFRLARFDGLKYDQIADVLGISKRTVQNHMVIALKQLEPHQDRLRKLMGNG